MYSEGLAGIGKAESYNHVNVSAFLWIEIDSHCIENGLKRNVVHNLFVPVGKPPLSNLYPAL